MKELIKQSFLEGYASKDISVISVTVALLVSFVIGLYIYLVYKLLTRKTFYSRNFNISLVGISMITAAIIVTIQSSVVVSLGMVGALSIVRFRTAIKEPMDLMFLFWAISSGIICGAGFAIFAVILSLILTVAIILLNKLPDLKASMLLIVNTSDPHLESVLLKKVSDHTAHYEVKCCNMTAASLDLTVELRVSDGNILIQELVEIPGVESASLLKHDGETAY